MPWAGKHNRTAATPQANHSNRVFRAIMLVLRTRDWYPTFHQTGVTGFCQEDFAPPRRIWLKLPRAKTRCDADECSDRIEFNAARLLADNLSILID